MASIPRNGLTKQMVSLKLTGGIDRKTDPKQLQNGQMYTADNVQYIVEGQIRKRYGYTNLNPPGGLQGAPFAAVGCRDNVEPIILGSGALNRYNPTTGLSTSIPANTLGRLDSSSITSSSGVGTQASPPVNASCATDGQKYTLVTWEEIDTQTNIVFYGIQDLTTGSWILSPVQIVIPNGATAPVSGTQTPVVASGSPRALYYNGYFYIVLSFIASSTSGGTTQYTNVIEAYALNLLSLASGLISTSMAQTIGGSQTSAALALQTCGWDVAQQNGKMFLAWTNSSSSGTGYIRQFPISGQTISAGQSNTWTGQGPSSGSYTYPRVSISIGTNATIPIALMTPYSLLTLKAADLSTATTTNLSFGVSGTISYPTACLWVNNVAYGFAISAVQANATAYYVSVIGVNVASLTQVFSGFFPAPSTSLATGIVSRPWFYKNRLYIWVFGSGYAGWGTFREQVLLEIDSGSAALNYVARTSYQSAGLTNQPYNIVPNDVINIPNTNRYLSYMTQTTDVVGGTPATLGTKTTQASSAVVSNVFYGALTRNQFDFTPSTPNAIFNLPTGGNFIPGPIPQHYDGQALIEAGFSAAPELQTAPLVPASSSGVGTTNGQIPAGTYTYYFCFCRRDAYGNIIRSSPSSPYIVTLTTSTSFVTFPPIYYSRTPGVYLELYRTTLASPLQPQLLARINNGVKYTDNNLDSAIVNNPTLYTYSGELPNDPPPAVHSMAFGETRAYIIPSDSRNTIWCSKKYAPGRSVEWSSNLILTEGGTHSGSFTAIAVLDTNIIVFKQDQLLYFYGDGPDNTGANGSFGAFQKLSSDVGCIDPGSLAIIPAGLLFRSQRGIELLSRGLQVSYVGWPVEPIVQGITTIASATVMPQYQQVRFVPSVAGQPVLVYDYLANRWSTYSSMASLSTANVLGNYWWISADGSTCNIETPKQFLDAGTNFIQMTLETPEIPSANIQGWGRIYRIGFLGEMASSHVMSLSFAYDHQEYYTDTIIYNAASSNDQQTGLTFDQNGQYPVIYILVPGPEQFRLSRVPRQVMQTVRIKLQDTPITVYYYNDQFQPYQLPYGESCAISNLTFETGQKAILAKLPGSQTV